MWAYHRRGAGGKTARVYALVDAHWDIIEADLGEVYHFDAMDYFRGTRDWNQFLRLVDRLALREGTAVWAAKLSDDQMLEQLWEAYRKDRKLFDVVEDRRPSLHGFDKTQAMLLNIANLLIAQRIEANPATSRTVHMLPSPIFPAEAIELRWRALSRKKRESGIEAAQDKWTRIYEETGVKPNG